MTTKVCTRCKEPKPMGSFNRRYGKNRQALKLRSWCKDCYAEIKRIHYAANPQREMERSKKWRKDNPKKDRAIQIRASLSNRYGLTREQWDQMLIAQDGRCYICRKPMTGTREPMVDHDHITGAVRKLLCSRCNRLLGAAGDSVDTLRSAITYLVELSQ